MTEALNFSVMPEAEIARRISAGALAKIDNIFEIKVIDCADARPPTVQEAEHRLETFGRYTLPARYAGGSIGIVDALIHAYGAQEGELALTQLCSEFEGNNPTPFLASALSQDSYDFYGIRTHIHSSAAVEGDTERITSPRSNDNVRIDCAYATFEGEVGRLSATHQTALTAGSIAIELGHNRGDWLNANAAYGAQLYAKLRGANVTFGRQDAREFLSCIIGHIPTTVLQSNKPKNANLVIDTSGYLSDPAKHIAIGAPNYSHTVEIARIGAKVLAPYIGVCIDNELIDAASMAQGIATATKLGVPIEVLK